MITFTPLAFALAHVASVSVAGAPSPQASAQAKGTIPAELNLSIPSTPAADLLGLTGSNVTAVTSLQQIASSVLTGGNSSNSTSTGYDYTFKAAQIGLTHTDVNLRKYFDARNQWMRSLYGLQLSVAFSKDPSLPQAVSSVSAAVALPLLDKTDWRTDPKRNDEYIAQLAGYYPEIIPDVDTVKNLPEDLGHAYARLGLAVNNLNKVLSDATTHLPLTAGDKTMLQDAMKAARGIYDGHGEWKDKSDALAGSNLTAYIGAADQITKAAEEYKTVGDKAFQAQAKIVATKISDETWNFPKLSFAGGYASQSSGTSAFSSQGFGTWMTYQTPAPTLFGVSSAGLLYGKYFNNISEKFSTMKDAADLSGYTLAARWQGGSSSFGGFVEFEYQEGKPSIGARDFDHVFQAGFEQKLGTQWIQVGVGKSLQNGHGFILGLQFATTFSTTRSLTDEGVNVPTSQANAGQPKPARG